MGSHSVTHHPTEVRIPLLPPAEAGTRFSDPGWMQGWVDLCYVKATGRELNPRPVNRKSDALPLSHHATRSFRLSFCKLAFAVYLRFSLTKLFVLGEEKNTAGRSAGGRTPCPAIRVDGGGASATSRTSGVFFDCASHIRHMNVHRHDSRSSRNVCS